MPSYLIMYVVVKPLATFCNSQHDSIFYVRHTCSTRVNLTPNAKQRDNQAAKEYHQLILSKVTFACNQPPPTTCKQPTLTHWQPNISMNLHILRVSCPRFTAARLFGLQCKSSSSQHQLLFVSVGYTRLQPSPRRCVAACKVAAAAVDTGYFYFYSWFFIKSPTCRPSVVAVVVGGAGLHCIDCKSMWIQHACSICCNVMA